MVYGCPQVDDVYTFSGITPLFSSNWRSTVPVHVRKLFTSISVKVRKPPTCVTEISDLFSGTAFQHSFILRYLVQVTGLPNCSSSETARAIYFKVGKITQHHSKITKQLDSETCWKTAPSQWFFTKRKVKIRIFADSLNLDKSNIHGG